MKLEKKKFIKKKKTWLNLVNPPNPWSMSWKCGNSIKKTNLILNDEIKKKYALKKKAKKKRALFQCIMLYEDGHGKTPSSS